MESGQLDILSIILHSSLVVKMVLIILLVASIISWAIIIKKLKINKKLVKKNSEFMDIFRSAVNLKEVRDKSSEIEFSTFSLMFQNGHDELSKIKKLVGKTDGGSTVVGHFQSFGLSSVERALKKGVNESTLKLEQFLSLLASIGAITPFVGLLGTVWGIIDAFTGLAGKGASLDVVAPGIAEALIATAVGLAAAIPAVFFYNYFVNENSKFVSQMENFGQDFLNLVERSAAISK